MDQLVVIYIVMRKIKEMDNKYVRRHGKSNIH